MRSSATGMNWEILPLAKNNLSWTVGPGTIALLVATWSQCASMWSRFPSTSRLVTPILPNQILVNAIDRFRVENLNQFKSCNTLFVGSIWQHSISKRSYAGWNMNVIVKIVREKILRNCSKSIFVLISELVACDELRQQSPGNTRLDWKQRKKCGICEFCSTAFFSNEKKLPYFISLGTHDAGDET